MLKNLFSGFSLKGALIIGAAVASGVLKAVQGAINGAMGKIVGTLEGTFIVHVVGLACVSILLFVFSLGKGDLSNIPQIPWYLYLGGLINVAIIFFVMTAIGAEGAGNATIFILVGQMVMAVIIDHFGLFGLEQNLFTLKRLGGLALLAVAANLILSK